MAFAGLYWGGDISSVVIITTDRGGALPDIPHPDPLQMTVDDNNSLDAWLDPSQSPEQIRKMTAPSPAAPLTWHPSPPEVGRNTENHKGLIEAYDAAAHDPQPSLF